ncbi:restriction endonuclease subunit S [Treponema zuelzerae]|uniref:Restriction endonuclease subunit S n=1 Tax=Teretinema zuelzerae TaxID=156 RepID=A0AAE3JK23_9SPIR|nr:restriction endonuclease subunit S [Teretinema zuelzerae]MCD1653564.1 restriction endonuclease subunit S [Teretinema zuelzerae]
MKLSDLFEIHNGLTTTNLTIYSKSFPGSIPFLRPSSTQQRTLAGWIKKESISSEDVYPIGSLFVSTNGEGSHTYSYVSQFEFACNSDVSVLLPKKNMSISEKIYYAKCITANRFRFSYGRKPKGNRLKDIDLPNAIPIWVQSLKLDDITLNLDIYKYTTPSKSITTGDREYVRLSEIFDVNYGTSLELNRLDKTTKSNGGIPFISRVMGNNGVSAYVKKISGIDPIQANVLSCALGGNVLSTFLQEEPFYSGRDVAYLVPKYDLSKEELLFYCYCIELNKFRFSYGRQANRSLKHLYIPSISSIPEWVYGSVNRVIESIDISPSPSLAQAIL